MKRGTPVFLCGYPKSGTTLLLSLLDSHPNLLVFPEETNFFKKCYKFGKVNIKKLLLSTDTVLPARGDVDVASGRRDYSNIDGAKYLTSLKERLSNAPNVAEKYHAIFDNWFEFATHPASYDYKYVVEKTPKNELYIEKIRKIFKNPKFIYILRDPRDNYISYRKKHPNLTVENFSNNWEVSALIAYKCINDEDFLLLRYEELVSQPEDTLIKICSFLDVPFNRALLTPTRNGLVWKGNSMFGANHGKIHSVSIGRYHKFDEDKIKSIEGYLSKTMVLYGFKMKYSLKETCYTPATYIKRFIKKFRDLYI